jgi:hypothetical protein
VTVRARWSGIGKYVPNDHGWNSSEFVFFDDTNSLPEPPQVVSHPERATPSDGQ